MNETHDEGRRLYKARGPDGEVAWVDHDQLWRLQQGQTEQLRRDRARRRRLVLLGLVGLVALALALVTFRLRSGVESVPDPDATADPPTVAAGPRVPTAEPQPSSLGATPDPLPSPSPTERVAGAVRSWAAAWARQDVPAYLAGYAAGFEPAGGSSRSSWESLRRRRLLAPSSIRVEIEELEIAFREGDRAVARFLQSYRSPGYSDVVRKSLELVEQEGEWRIVSERAEAP